VKSVGTGRKIFFFEKKKQKTFVPLRLPGNRDLSQRLE